LEEEGKVFEIYKQGIALAALQDNSKTKRELESAYQNFLLELDRLALLPTPTKKPRAYTQGLSNH
jgi:hypothetical protein